MKGESDEELVFHLSYNIKPNKNLVILYEASMVLLRMGTQLKYNNRVMCRKVMKSEAKL